MTRTLPAFAVVILIAVLSAAIVVQSSLAGNGTFTVTRNDDPAPDGCIPADCSFREAVNAANPADGTVEIPEGMDVVLTRGEVPITGDVNVMGAGSEDSSVSGNGESRVLNVSGNNVYIGGVEITDGSIPEGQCGAGIFNTGTTTLHDVLVSSNNSSGAGAGVCNEGTMTVEDSVIDDNGAMGDPSGGGVLNSGMMDIVSSFVTNNTATNDSGGGDGAGVVNTETGTMTIMYTLIEGNAGSSSSCDDCSSGSGVDNSGTIEIEYSWISENQGDAGAGMQNRGDATVRRSLFSGNEAGAIRNSSDAEMIISNTTISNNAGAPYPKAGIGGIQNFGNLSLINNTIASNTAFQFNVGGVHNQSPSGAVDYKATIFANNGGDNCGTAGTHISNGYNVFDDDSCATVGTDQADTGALLGPLQDNGGPTWSHYLGDGSPAINAGGPGCPTPDQLGANRVGGCDAGAVEKDGEIPTPSPTPSPTPAPDTYPLGDASCSDSIGIGDLVEVLKLAGGVSEPNDCGRDGGCVDVGGECYPQWTDVNCDGLINGTDALWIALYLIGDPPDTPGNCWEIGTYAVG